MHDPLIDLATVPPVPLDPAVHAARESLRNAVGDLSAVPDGSLDGPWRWRPTDADDLERRYGFYRIHERLEEAIATITVGWADGRGTPIGPTIGPAIPALRAMAVARWELHGALAPLADVDWDADPGGGEWTVRQTLGHIIASQRSYGWYNAWYLSQRPIVGEAVYPPDGTLPPAPSEEEEAAGAPNEVRSRLDDVVDTVASSNAGLDPAALQGGARWSGLPVTIGFRIGRYGSHIREHTVQVDKTLSMLGRRPTEVERLVRLILGTYGRLEALFVGRTPDVLAVRFADGSTATAILAAAIDDVVAVASRVRVAGGPGGLP